MRNRMWNKIAVATAVMVLAAPALRASIPTPLTGAELAGKVRHELVMLPWYGVFDNLAFQIEDGKVILLGQVTRPTLKSDAENVVKRIPGVTAVENRIEVLPLSRLDDQIRVAVARAVFGYSSLYRYGMGAQPSIRIIVNNGSVTLEGEVANETDRNLAAIRANGVPGVFSVTNNLKVADANS